MAKTIRFTYKDVDYTLEFTRHSVEVMESQGFDIIGLEKKVISSIPDLFKYSFLAHHKRTKQKDIEEMYKLFSNKQSLGNKLLEMIIETVNSLFEEPDDEKNAIKWEAN